MKTIKHLTYSLLATCSLLLTPCAFGAGSWAAINTKEYAKGDKEPSTAKAENYEAYYCTVAAAETMFGGSTVEAINAYLSKNFMTGKTAMADQGVALDQQAYFAKNQYTFIEYYGTDIAQGDYLAVTFFESEALGLQAFRVFGKDNAVWDSGTLTFDDKAAGTVGSWQTVPEPTGGMLLLLGFAALSLWRKRVVGC